MDKSSFAGIFLALGGILFGLFLEGGKLAQIGSRLIDGTARKMADDFFNRFVALMTPSATSE